MAAAAPIFTAAGAAVPCSAFRRGAGRHATAAAREAAAAATREFGGDDGLTTAAAENAPLPISSSLLTHRVVAEYLYLGGSGTDMRSVTRVVEVPRGAPGAAARPDPSVVAALPLIAVDGAATRQGGLGGGSNHCSALFLKPRSAWLDPLRGGGALLVLCEAYSPPALGPEVAKKFSPTSPNSTQQPNSSSSRKLHPAALSPHPTNNRAFAERAARAAASEEPLFAVTQQYLLCEGDGRPLGWTSEGPPQASCYGSPDGAGFFPWNGETGSAPFINSSSSSSAASARGRAVADAHLSACLSAGLAATGCRAEQASGQWSFSLGPLPPLEAADQLWAARWLLRAVAAAGSSTSPPLAAVTDALPPHLSKFEGRWDGNGCRVKFSTRATRSASPGGGGGGRAALRHAVGRLAAAHAAHMMVYGAGAALRCERAAERERERERARAADAVEMSPPRSPATPTEAEAAAAAAAASLAPPPPPLHIPQQARFAGVEDSGALLRIPAAVALHGRGHLEDRRPAGGCDPYLAFTLLLCTTLGLPLPLAAADRGVDASSPSAAAAASSSLKRRVAAKRARCCGGERQQQLAPLASAAASGSGENLCPNANQNINRTAAAASLLACDEQVAESAQQDGEGEGEENGGGAAAAPAAAAPPPVENNFDPEEEEDSDSDDEGGVRSSALLLAEDADDDDDDDEDDENDDDLVSTPLTPTRDAADGGATTVAGPDNREASSSAKRRRRSSDLDDDATSSSSNGAT